MADMEDDAMKFQREKAVFEQNCLQLRALIQEFHKTPLMSATLTGGLVAVLSVFKQHDEQFEVFAVVVCALVALFNAMIGISCIRIRDVMESYIEKASRFSEDFGERSGMPSRPILKWLGSFSIALGYAVMMWVMASVAVTLPIWAYGWSWFNALPCLMTLSGVGGWFLWAHLRHRRDREDPIIAYYDKQGQGYIEETMRIDMSDEVRRFARHLKEGARVLDVGAGAGRDSKTLQGEGFTVVALEPCRTFAEHLRGIPGIEVQQIKAQEMEEVETFDAIWACASLVHFDEKQLPKVMKKLCRALRPNGYFYMCFKNGAGVRIPSRNGILFHDMAPDRLNDLATESGLKVVEMWSNESRLRGRNDAHWNNVIARKPF
jgi:SAM-dependent methyltransferase